MINRITNNYFNQFLYILVFFIYILFMCFRKPQFRHLEGMKLILIPNQSHPYISQGIQLF